MAAGTSTVFSKALEAYNMKPKVLWQHSLTTALGGRKIADAVSPTLANEAFLAGLFHDVGKLILDEQIYGLECSSQQSFNFGDPLDGHGRTFLNGFTVTVA